MLAASKVKAEEEAVAIINIALDNLHAWFDEVPQFDGQGNRDEVIAAQDY